MNSVHVENQKQAYFWMVNLICHLKGTIMSSKDFSKMYDALLSLGVLDRLVKLDIRVPCRMTLLLAMAVEQGMSGTDPGNPFKKVVSEEDQKKLLELTAEILKKAELEGFYQKLKELGQG